MKISRESQALPLVGAICGDIIGSWYEFIPTKELDFELFTDQSRFTDDTIGSVAVTYA